MKEKLPDIESQQRGLLRDPIETLVTKETLPTDGEIGVSIESITKK